MSNTKGRILKNPEFSNIRFLEFSLMVNTKSRMISKKVEDFQTPNPEAPMLFARPVVIASCRHALI